MINWCGLRAETFAFFRAQCSEFTHHPLCSHIGTKAAEPKQHHDPVPEWISILHNTSSDFGVAMISPFVDAHRRCVTFLLSKLLSWSALVYFHGWLLSFIKSCHLSVNLAILSPPNRTCKVDLLGCIMLPRASARQLWARELDLVKSERDWLLEPTWGDGQEKNTHTHVSSLYLFLSLSSTCVCSPAC